MWSSMRRRGGPIPKAQGNASSKGVIASSESNHVSPSPTFLNEGWDMSSIASIQLRFTSDWI